jgi:hypothetical protein
MIFNFILFSQANSIVSKCYKDICVGDKVLVNTGLYKGNKVTILDIIKVVQSDDDAEQVRDYYKYYVSFRDGTITYLYREELEK